MTTEAITPNQNLVEELKAIRKDLEYIKKHMFDPDTIMTKEEDAWFKHPKTGRLNLIGNVSPLSIRKWRESRIFDRFPNPALLYPDAHWFAEVEKRSEMRKKRR